MKKQNSFAMIGLLIVTIIILSGFLTGCGDPFADDSQTAAISVKMKQLAHADVELDTLVKGLAPIILTDDSLLAILRDELARKFDGETEVLFSTFSSLTMDHGVTVGDYIREKLAAAADNADGNSKIDFDGILDNLDDLINLHIYMPNFDHWTDSTPFVLTYLPLASIGTEVNEVVAYNSSLQPVTVNEGNLDSYRLLVFGPNERTDTDGLLRKDLLIDPLSAVSRGIGLTRDGAREYLSTMKIYDDHEGFLQGGPEIILYYKYGKENSQFEINYHDNFKGKINTDVGFNADLGPWDEGARGTYLFLYAVEDDLDVGIKVTVGAEAKLPVASGVTISGSASVTFEIKWGDDKLGNICVDYRDVKNTRYRSDSNQFDCVMTYTEREICKPEHPCVQYEPDGVVANQSPAFRWEDVPGADTFNLYVYRTSDNVLVGQVFELASAAYTFDRPFKTNTNYYWTIEGVGRCGVGPLSSKMPFTVNDGTLQTISLVSPKGSITAAQPTFVWTSTIFADSYTLTVYRADNGATVFEESGITDTSYGITESLPANVNLSWKVAVSVIGAVDNTYVSASAAFRTTGTIIIDPEPTAVPTATTTTGPDEPTPEPVFTLSVFVLTSSGGNTTTNYPNLTLSSVQPIYAPAMVYVGYGSSGTLYEFRDWQLSGNATIDNAQSASTNVRNMRSNASVTANYQLPTPEPTPLITPEPPTFTLRVGLMTSTGSYEYTAYPGLLATSAQSISAPATIWVGSVGYGGTTLEFHGWQLSGGATIDNATVPYTTVRNFTGNAEVTAQYWQPTITEPPAATPDPTAAPVITPDPVVTDPPAVYTLYVSSVESGGTSTSQTYTGLTSASTVNICTTSGWTINTGYSTITISFVCWHVSGATLDNSGSSCTTVRNITTNASVTPEYKQY